MANTNLLNFVNNNNNNNNNKDAELGTPSLYRPENVTLAVSSYGAQKDALLLQIKWRPCDEDEELVCLSIRFVLELKQNYYEHNQTVTYRPRRSSKRKRIMQYGDKHSSLRLIITAPHRRMRLIFNGPMCEKQSPSEYKFIKADFTIKPTGAIFDFCDDVNIKFMTEQYIASNIGCGLNEAINQLVVHDRHEQLIIIKGGYTIQDVHPRCTPFSSASNRSLVKETFVGWGYHARQFVDSHINRISPNLRTKRILTHFDNGHAFHIVQNTISGCGSMDFGYTSFRTRPEAEPLGKKLDIDWSNIDKQTSEFELAISNQGKDFKCTAKRRNENSVMFDIDMDGELGWACITINDYTDSRAEIKAMDASLIEYQGASLERTPWVVIDDPIRAYEALDKPKAASPGKKWPRNILQTFSSVLPLSAGITTKMNGIFNYCHVAAREYRVPSGIPGFDAIVRDIILDTGNSTL